MQGRRNFGLSHFTFFFFSNFSLCGESVTYSAFVLRYLVPDHLSIAGGCVGECVCLCCCAQDQSDNPEERGMWVAYGVWRNRDAYGAE